MWVIMNLLEDIGQVVTQNPNGSPSSQATSSVPTQSKPIRGNSLRWIRQLWSHHTIEGRCGVIREA